MSFRLVAVPCKLYPGMFPSERLFAVVMANGETHWGLSPCHFCWNGADQIVSESEVTKGIDGKIAGKLHYVIDAEQVAVEVPDAEMIAILNEHVLERPTKIVPPPTPAEMVEHRNVSV